MWGATLCIVSIINVGGDKGLRISLD